ncbi:MAG: hypothetical protein ACRCTL_04110 [Pseudomonas sp.]
MPAINQLSLALLSLALLTACNSQAQNQALSSDISTSQVTQEGVPGSLTTQVERVSAVVSAIDYEQRSFTLKDAQGNSRDFKAPPEMLNFPQLKVGDQVNATVTLEQLVYLREPGAPSADGAAGLVAAAPEGSKPGILVADTIEVTAVVKAIDVKLHTATLQFADGSQKTVQVRPDVQLKDQYLNSRVVIRLSSALAIRVEPKP